MEKNRALDWKSGQGSEQRGKEKGWESKKQTDGPKVLITCETTMTVYKFEENV